MSRSRTCNKLFSINKIIIVLIKITKQLMDTGDFIILSAEVLCHNKGGLLKNQVALSRHYIKLFYDTYDCKDYSANKNIYLKRLFPLFNFLRCLVINLTYNIINISRAAQFYLLNLVVIGRFMRRNEWTDGRLLLFLLKTVIFVIYSYLLL